jgi:hypothetical protein
LLLAWGNQACRWWEFWGLVTSPVFQEHTVQWSWCWLGRTKPTGSGSSGVRLPHSFRDGSTVALLPAQGNQACWLAPSITHRGSEAMDPAYTGVPVSLAFPGEGSRSYRREGCGAPSSCVCQEAGLTAEHFK